MSQSRVFTPGSSITENGLLGVNIAMIVVVSIVVIMRMVVQIIRHKKPELQDYLIYTAFLFQITMSVLGIIITPLIYKMGDVASGKLTPYPEFPMDAAKMARLIFAGQVCFWLCLWAVKFSLLALYKNLLAGLPVVYMRVWWGISVFCILSFVGVIIADTRVCKDMNAFFTEGACNSPGDINATLFCMYLAYASDVFTDLLIMFVPLRLVWNLQMPPMQKAGICVLFSSALACIAFATIRVANISVEGGNHLDPRRTALWTILETAVAIIVGCSPAFVALARGRKNTQNHSPSAQGYIQRSRIRMSRHDAEKGIKLKSMVSSGSRGTMSGAKTNWEHNDDSQEELANGEVNIVVENIPDRDGSQSGTSQMSVRM